MPQDEDVLAGMIGPGSELNPYAAVDPELQQDVERIAEEEGLLAEIPAKNAPPEVAKPFTPQGGKIHGMSRKEFETSGVDVTEEQAAAITKTGKVAPVENTLAQTIIEEGMGFGNALIFGDYGLFGKARRVDELHGGKVVGPVFRGALNLGANMYNLGVEGLGLAMEAESWLIGDGGGDSKSIADLRIDIHKQLGENPIPDAWGTITIPLSKFNEEWADIPLPVTTIAETVTSFLIPFGAASKVLNAGRHGGGFAGMAGKISGRNVQQGALVGSKYSASNVGKVMATEATAGFLADPIAWDPAMGNISDLLIQSGFDNEWTQRLSSKRYVEDGQFITARFMMALEGLPLGILADGLLRSVGYTGRGAANIKRTIAKSTDEMGLNPSQLRKLDRVGKISLARNVAATEYLESGMKMSDIPAKLEEDGLGLQGIPEEDLITAMGTLVAHDNDIPQLAGEQAVSGFLMGKGEIDTLFILSKSTSSEIDLAANTVKTVDGHGVETVMSLHQDKRIMGTARGERSKGVAKLNKRDSQVVDDAISAHGLDEETSNSIKSQVADSMARHPKSEWQPLEIASIKQKVDADGKLVVDDSGNAVLKVKYKKIPYTFHRNRNGKAYAVGSPQRKRRVKDLGGKLEKEVLEVRARAAAGDEVAKTILGHANWYATMRQRLGREWGVYRDLVGELLGALSPQTKVKANFANMTNVMHHYTRGAFDDVLEAYGKHRQAGGTFKEWVEAGNKVIGKDGLVDSAVKDLADEGFTKFGFNTGNAMDTLTGHWYSTRKGVQGKGVKAVNFAANLLGRDNQATIDVWAARFLERLAGRKPIPPNAEGAVQGSYIKGTDPTKDTAGSAMGFGQEVFENAAKRLGMSADDLQAVGWFMEKEKWTKKNWTNLDGEGGSFDLESDLIRPQRVVMEAGVQDPTKVAAAQTTARTIIGDDPTATAYSVGENYRYSGGEGEASLHVEVTYSNTQKPGRAPQLDAEGNPILGKDGKPKFKTVSETDQVPDFGSARRTMAQLGKDGDQDAMMGSLVLDLSSSEGNILKSNPNARPGVEIYFDSGVTPEEVAKVVAFLKSKGLGAQTINEAERGATRAGGNKVIGIRSAYVPEFDDAASGLIGKTDDAIAHMERKFEEFADLQRELVELDPVARAEVEAFDTITITRDDYDRILSDDRTPVPTKSEDAWGSRPWHETPEGTHGTGKGRELDEGVSGADGRPGEQRLRQDERGEALIDTESGVAFIRGITAPDASTAVHELGHALHAQLLAGGNKKQLKAMEDAFGVVDGNWDEAAMENFARNWESYIANPEGLAAGQANALSYIAAQIRDVYKDVQGSPLARQIKPDVAKFFASLMTRTDLPIRYAPGKYMPAIGWDKVVARVKQGLKDGEDLNDMIQEDDILGTARMRDPELLKRNPDRSGLRPSLDPKRSTFGISPDDPHEILKVAAAYGDLTRKLMDEDIIPPLSNEIISKRAVNMYARLGAVHEVPSEQVVAEVMITDAREHGEGAVKVFVANFMLQNRLKKLQQAQKAADSSGSIVDKALLQREAIAYQYVAAIAQLKRAQAGQDLQAWGAPLKLPTEKELTDATKAAEFLKSIGRDSASVQEIANGLRGLDPNDLTDLGLISEVIKSSNKQIGGKFRGVVQEIYTNWLLSGPATYTGLAAISPALTLGITGAGKFATSVATGNFEVAAQTLTNLRHNIGNMTTALEYALKTAAKEEGQLMPGRELNDASFARKAVWTDREPGSFAGKAGKWVLNHVIGGVLVRHPSRAIMTIDEFFRQMAGRTALADKSYTDNMAKLVKKAQRPGGKLENANRFQVLRYKSKMHDTVSEMVDKEIQNTIKDGHLRNEQTLIHEAINDPKISKIDDDYEKGMAVAEKVNTHRTHRHNELVRHVEDYATRPVFQGDLGPNASGFQKFLDQNTWGIGRILIPFYRTPMNLMEQAFGMSPTTIVSEVAQKLNNLRGGRTPEFEVRLKAYTDHLETKYGKHIDEIEDGDLHSSELAALRRRQASVKRSQQYGLPEEAELWRYHRKHMEDLRSGDPRRMMEARGRQASGMALMGLAWYWYENDMIQGAGPYNSHKRKIWSQNGGMPYSVKIGEKRYQFRKMDPFATVLAIVADGFEVLEADPTIREQDKTNLLAVMFYALTKQLNEKMFIKSLTALTDAFANPDPEDSGVLRWQKQFLGTLIPWNSLQRAMSYATDPVVADTRKIMDNIKATTVWGGGEAPPQYTILGEPVSRLQPDDGWWQTAINIVSPIRIQSVSTDELMIALEKLDYPFHAESYAVYNGIELRDVAGPEDYDWSVFHYMKKIVGDGTIKIDDLTLRQTLEAYLLPSGNMHHEYIRHGKVARDPKTGHTIQQTMVSDIISKFYGLSHDYALANSPEYRNLDVDLNVQDVERHLPLAIEERGEESSTVSRMRKEIETLKGYKVNP